MSGFFEDCLWKFSRAPTSRWLVQAVAERVLCEFRFYCSELPSQLIPIALKRIQLLERFYDPLIGDIHVCH